MKSPVAYIFAFVDFPVAPHPSISKPFKALLSQRLAAVLDTDSLGANVEIMGRRLVIMFSAPEPGAALKALREQLEALGLSAQIGWYDSREDIYRCFHPEGASAAEFERYHRRLQEILEMSPEARREAILGEMFGPKLGKILDSFLPKKQTPPSNEGDAT